MVNRKTVCRDSQEWREMWQALAGYEVARGTVELSPDWEYIGTEQSDAGQWSHLFRHVNHPRTNRTMVVKIAASGHWVMVNDKNPDVS